MGWGLFSNPANWAITDTLQGQEGGWTMDNNWLGMTRAAGNSMGSPATKPYGSAGIGVSNPSGYTYVKGATAPTQGGQPSGNPVGTDNPQVSGNNTSYSGSGGSGRSSGPAYDPQDLQYLDSQRSLYQELLNRIGTTERQGLEGIEDQYQKGLDRANKTQSRALQDYDLNERNTNQGKTKAIGQVNQNSRSLANSVRRMLGLAGALGGSAYNDISTGVAKVASGERGDVLGDYASNMAQLNTARDRTKDDYQDLLGDLSGQKQSSTRAFKSDVEGQRQSLQQILDEIAAKRANLVGGNLESVLREGRERFLGYEDKMNALPDQYRNSIKARDVAFEPVSLKDYMVDRASIQANQQQGGDAYSPYRQFLRRNEEEER